MKSIDLFKQNLAPLLTDYKIDYRSYSEGDFGALKQVIIESEKIGGGIDFWSKGWLGLELYDYSKDNQLINVLLSPEQRKEEDNYWQKFEEFLKR
ncbi:hypothetical protein FACS1894192_09410 [Bacilli bacterium]|nr:hypothetical protein FACS1894192_09410 [Bacilli bacterium]